MTVRNHFLSYRPLVAGVAILNPSVNRLGTLGFFAHAPDGGVFIVSAAHVLTSRHANDAVDGEPIYQPLAQPGADPVACTSALRTDSELDVAAAKLGSAIGWSPTSLGIGAVGPPVAPRPGMRVIKSGMATAVTEGVIRLVQGAEITIAPEPHYAPGYNLCDPGDSGAAWVDRATRRLVAIHLRGNDTGPEIAHAIDARAALASLNLTASTHQQT